MKNSTTPESRIQLFSGLKIILEEYFKKSDQKHNKIIVNHEIKPRDKLTIKRIRVNLSLKNSFEEEILGSIIVCGDEIICANKKDVYKSFEFLNPQEFILDDIIELFKNI